MKKYQAIKYGDGNKIKEHYIIYRIVKKGKKYDFCFTLLEHVAFINSRKSGLNGLIEDAIAREPQTQYFEYTGSHFEPVSNPSWRKLPWEKINSVL